MLGMQSLVKSWQGVAGGVALAALVAAAVVQVSSAAQAPREWRDYAGGPDSSRFVAATQITKGNVGKLQVAWTYADGDTDFNPLVVRGVIYTRARGNTLVAVDAATGKELWASAEIKAFAIRGVNYWESADGSDQRLLFSTLNMLRALDAKTGKPIPTFGKDGVVDLREGLDRDPSKVEQQSRLPGRVFENLLILGSATNREYVSAPGDIRAYDVRTGALVWSFRTVPRTGDEGADTWPANARATVGGANNWAESSVDVARGIVYVPTGSAKHNFYGGYRHGDNLYSDSLIALDARTGKRLWHFQTVHHDIWDVDNNSAPQLTTVRHDGRSIDVVAQASKTGYLYVFDRATGKPIWPIEERPVPQGTTVPGEKLSPTQPFPTRPEPFARQSFTVDDLNPVHPHAGGTRTVPAAHREGTQRGAVHADRLRGSRAHAGQPGRIELGQHGGQSDRRTRVRDRLQRADDPQVAEARREASRARGRTRGDRARGLSGDRRVRALPDDHQAALHDPDGVRPEHGRHRLAEGPW